MQKVRGTIAVLLLALAACSAPWEPNAGGDPPITGNWVPSGFDGATNPCGIDTVCGLRLRLIGTSVTGQFQVQELGGETSQNEVHGTYTAPNLHVEWSGGQLRWTFDATVRDDTLLVGIFTPPETSLASPAAFHKLH